MPIALHTVSGHKRAKSTRSFAARLARLLFSGALAMSLVACGANRPSQAQLEALATVYSLGATARFTRDWCFEQAPQTKAAVKSAYDSWLRDTQLDVINRNAATAFGSQLAEIDQSLEAKRPEIYASLEKANVDPVPTCRRLREALDNWMDPRKQVPAEYAQALAFGAGADADSQRVSAEAEPSRNASGVQSGQIATVLHDGESVYTVNGMQYEESWALLLEDGWGYREPKLSPADLDIAASRRDEPNKWFQWRRAGKSYQKRDRKTGDWVVLEGSPVRGARSDQRLDGTYTAYSYADRGGLGGYASKNSIEFRRDGSFESFGSFIGGTGGMQADNGFSSTATASRSKNGCTSGSTMASDAAGGGSTRRTDCAGDNTGRYTLDGYTLELRYDSGNIRRALFFFPLDDERHIFIGSTTYIADK